MKFTAIYMSICWSLFVYSCNEKPNESSTVRELEKLKPEKDSLYSSISETNPSSNLEVDNITFKDTLFMGFYQYMSFMSANKILKEKYSFYLDEKGDSVSLKPTLYFYQTSGKLIDSKKGISEDERINSIDKDRGIAGFKGIILKGQISFESFQKLVKLYQGKYGSFYKNETSKDEFIRREPVGTEEIEKPPYFSYDDYMLIGQTKLNDNIIKKMTPQKIDKSEIILKKEDYVRYDYHIALLEKFKTDELGLPRMRYFKAIPIMADYYQIVRTTEYSRIIDGNKYIRLSLITKQSKNRSPNVYVIDLDKIFDNFVPTYDFSISYFFIDEITIKPSKVNDVDSSKLLETIRNI